MHDERNRNKWTRYHRLGCLECEVYSHVITVTVLMLFDNLHNSISMDMNLCSDLIFVNWNTMNIVTRALCRASVFLCLVSNFVL